MGSRLFILIAKIAIFILLLYGCSTIMLYPNNW